MQLIFLGSGSAFTVGANNYQSNALLKSERNRTFLIDCGTDIRLSLFEQKFKSIDIENVYISHLHADHAGGLEWLAFDRHFNAKGPKPILWIEKSMAQTLWENSLKAGLSSLQYQSAKLELFFEVRELLGSETWIWEEWTFQMIQVIHAMDGFALMPSYGLWLEKQEKKVLYTSDTQFILSQIWDFYERATLIFQDCETQEIRSGVHAHYLDLKTLPVEIRNKMWLYHYQPGVLPDAKADGFLGFVQRGQSFDL